MKHRILYFGFLIFMVCFFVFVSQVIHTVWAIDFPTKPIQVMVTFPPGGPTDTEARLISSFAEKILNERILILNVAGAGGISGWNQIRTFKKDGYSLTTFNLPHIFAQPQVQKTSFTWEDFEPIIHWGNDPTVFAVTADSPYKTIEDLIADAKQNPGTVTMGTAGLYLGHHLAILLLNEAAGIEIKTIPFTGSAPSIAALLGKKTTAISDNLSDMYRLGDQVRVLALAWPKRHEFFPNVPTMAEKGHPTVLMSSDRGIAAPVGIPKPILEKLINAYWEAGQIKEFQERARKAGIDLTLMRPPEIQKYWEERKVVVRKILEKHRK